MPHPVGPFDLAYDLLFEALGTKHPFKSGYEADASSFPEFVGVYRLEDGETLTVTLDDGQLMAQPSGDDAYPIEAFAEDAFFYTGYQEFIEFARDTSGQVSGVNIHYGLTEEFSFAARE